MSLVYAFLTASKGQTYLIAHEPVFWAIPSSITETPANTGSAASIFIRNAIKKIRPTTSTVTAFVPHGGRSGAKDCPPCYGWVRRNAVIKRLVFWAVRKTVAIKKRIFRSPCGTALSISKASPRAWPSPITKHRATTNIMNTAKPECLSSSAKRSDCVWFE